jgi:Fic family protein
MTMRSLGEFRGRQHLYADQFPEVLATLRRVAIVQSTESSNRIEGIIVAPDRIDALVLKKIKPRDRSEQEVAGYRDVLSSIHANHENIRLSTGQILEWHRSLYRFTEERGGEWKAKDNAILEVRPDGRQVVRFQPGSALATPEFMDKLLSLFDRALDKAETDPLLQRHRAHARAVYYRRFETSLSGCELSNAPTSAHGPEKRRKGEVSRTRPRCPMAAYRRLIR